ncbi:MAG: hypothetical protein QM703_11985 [Gemmatales bacterium]
MKQIPNEALTLDLIPPKGSDWDTAISPFALTMNGHAAKLKVGRHSDIDDILRSGTLTDLRAWLFSTQRMQHHVGYPLDDKAMADINQVLERIRFKVAAGELE